MNAYEPPEGYRKIASLTIVRGNVTEVIHRCDDCPMFEDPDPRPCYCSLDPMPGASWTRTVDVLRSYIPDACPMATLRVEVTPREAEESP